MYPSNARPEFFQISGGEEISNINFTISPTALSSVSGRIEGVAPHSTYWLILTPIDQPRLSIAVQPATDDGSFQLTGIPPGSYHLLTHGPITGRTSGAGIIGPATKFARTRVDLAGQPVSGITLSPHPGVGGIVKVQIEPGAESDCPASLRVFLTPIEDWAAQLSKDVTATLEGAVVGNLAPARYNLTVMQPKDNCHQIGAAILDLTVSDPVPGVLRMGASGSIRGRLSGGASQGTVVTLMSEAASNAKPVVLAKPDAEGRFSFPSLAPGKYLIGLGRDSADSQSRWLDRGSALRQVEVSTGKATEVELAPLGAKP